MDSFVSMCRLCLKSCQDGVDLFTSGNGYSEQLQDTFQIQLLPIDQWPSNACTDCIDSLDEASEIKKRIELTQRQLHDLISQVKVEGSDTYPDMILPEEESDDGEKPVLPEICFESLPDASDIEDMKPEVTTPADGPQKKVLRARPSTSKATPLTRAKRLKIRKTREQKNELEKKRKERATAKEEQDHLRMSLDKMMRKQKLFNCHICAHRNSTFDELNQHMKLAHTRQSGYIFCCEKKYSKSYAYDHMTYHLDENKFACDVCDKKCTTGRELKFHKMTHDPSTRTFICETCGKRCKDKNALTHHQKIHRPLEEWAFKCHYCGKYLYDKKNLKSHINTLHEKIATNICEKCGMGYANADLLTQHMKRVHTERKTEQCPMCMKFFFSLRGHVDICNKHPGPAREEPRIKCTECGKDMRRRVLSYHMKYYHSDFKKPKCEICDKEFRTPAQYRAHRNIHLDIRKPCHFCPFSAVESGNLIVHMKAKHPAEYAEFRAKKYSEPRTKVVEPPGV